MCTMVVAFSRFFSLSFFYFCEMHPRTNKIHGRTNKQTTTTSSTTNTTSETWNEEIKSTRKKSTTTTTAIIAMKTTLSNYIMFVWMCWCASERERGGGEGNEELYVWCIKKWHATSILFSIYAMCYLIKNILAFAFDQIKFTSSMAKYAFWWFVYGILVLNGTAATAAAGTTTTKTTIQKNGALVQVSVFIRWNNP